MAPWEEALWFICTLLNLICLLLSLVYAFDIIGQEMEALEAQEQANKPRAGGGRAPGGWRLGLRLAFLGFAVVVR